MLRKVCSVNGCICYVFAKGLCSTHLKRFQRTNTTDRGRPKDWGERSRHPLYPQYKTLMKRHGGSVCAAWRDFWVYVSDVGDKPNPRSFLQRIDPSQQFSKDNFVWKTPNVDKIFKENELQYKRDYIKKWRTADPRRFKSYELKKRFGITLTDYEHLLDSQGGVCAVCKEKEEVQLKGKIKFMPVDHCHKTGKVRGILCDRCNRGIGLFSDSIEILESAVNYLRHNS